MSHAGRWYLVCWDLARDDWRTFRLDRMSHLLRTGVRVEPRELPVADPSDMVLATDTDSSYAFEAVIHLDIPLAEFQQIFGVWATGASANDAGGTDWPVGGNTLADLVYGPAWIPPEVSWTFSASDEVRALLETFGQQLAAAVYN